MFNPVQLGSNFARNAIIRYAPLAVGLMTIEHLFRSTAPAVGLMEIENLFRYTALAVGLKPSANQGKARLRGRERNNYSKTISPRLGKAKPACAGESEVIVHRPSALGYAGQSPPARNANSSGDPLDHRLLAIGYRLSVIGYRLSATISPQLWKVKPACAGYTGFYS